MTDALVPLHPSPLNCGFGDNSSAGKKRDQPNHIDHRSVNGSPMDHAIK